MNFAHIALQVPTVWLPRPAVDLTRWAVVACDQYTSQPDYWTQVETWVGDAPSTLRLMLPEIYLGAADEEERITAIQSTMRRYLDQGILVAQPPGFVLIERRTAHGRIRCGLMAALDLEHYDFTPGAKSLIRPTEGTIMERLPPRIRVREQALLELPHVMVLIDDPEHTVIEPLFAERLEPLYDTPLMFNSGQVRGWRIGQPGLIQQVAECLSKLADPVLFNKHYGTSDEPVMLYALGDGNHSFAAAKMIWERCKRTAPDPVGIMHHPARYALVELVNVHDTGLQFEAIHRMVFGVEVDRLLTEFTAFCQSQGTVLTVLDRPSWSAAWSTWREYHSTPGCQAIAFVSAHRCGVLLLERPRLTLPVANLQAFLDEMLPRHSGARLDYIHGDAALSQLSTQPGRLGFCLPALDKNAFFRTIIRDGVLPRKTFSMGEADEKRFYLECRRIV